MSNNGISHHIDRLKESFLCCAAAGGRIQECASLLEFGADVEWREHESDDNPLLAAVRNGQKDVASLLLAHGMLFVFFVHIMSKIY
jgi:ankyrin repeat protein